MRKVVFITPPDAKYGFSLAGIRHLAVEAGDALKTLQAVLAEPETGLIVMDERLIGAVGEERMREIEQAWNGVFLVLPSPVKQPPEIEDYAARLIRRAIGYHVRLRV